MPLDINEVFYRKIRDGRGYLASTVLSIDSGTTGNFHLKNPSDSDVCFLVSSIEVSSNLPAKVTIHDGFSSTPTGGTNVQIENLMLDTEGDVDEGQGVANEGVTYTSDSDHVVGIGGGGTGGNAIGGKTDHAAMVVQSGREIVLEIENIDSTTGDFIPKITYAELNR